MAASAGVADTRREFVAERVWGTTSIEESAGDSPTRHALVSSQLMGLAFTRDIMRVPPNSTASAAESARWAGPTLDRYISGPIGEAAPSDDLTNSGG